ncbi:hypothetical protein ACG7TL_005617 [Trametes sanguinea]
MFELMVQLDTGSSDLVVNLRGRQLDVNNSTNIHVKAQYVEGEADGVVAFADLQLGNVTISNQAFLNVTDLTNFNTLGDGILGVATTNGSTVFHTLINSLGEDTAAKLGQSPMQSLFTQRPDLASTFDLQLGRSNAVGDIVPSTFLVGEHDKNFEQVVNAPQLPSFSGAHWSAPMDHMTLNGQNFTFNSTILVPTGKAAAALDTGFPFPLIPAAAVDNIYSSIPGAMRNPQDDLGWIVPCNASTNVSFVFAGQDFFVHPLDLTIPTVTQVAASDGSMHNSTICLNTFHGYTEMPGEFAGFTLILGDAFLRNVYASFNLATGAGPFVQMVSTTPDLSAAITEFQTKRSADLATLPPVLDPATFIAMTQANAGSPQTPSSASQIADSAATPTQSAGPKPSNGAAQLTVGIHGVLLGAALLPLVFFM